MGLLDSSSLILILIEKVTEFKLRFFLFYQRLSAAHNLILGSSRNSTKSRY